jgi:hypothetical protein
MPTLIRAAEPEKEVAMLKVTTGFAAVLALGYSVALTCFAGEPQKWNDLPKAVQETILANGGMVGGKVDKESELVDGKVLYEAPVTDKDGSIIDLQITADGRLVDIKTDNSTDEGRKRIERGKKLLAGVTFSHPRDITNPYLPLATLKQDILEGKEGNTKLRIERTTKPHIRMTFKIGDQTVETLCVEDREFINGALAEVALDYFAQDDSGTVFYLGEDVDEYRDGKIVGHEGTWRFGRDTQSPGILFPGNPQVGDKFMSEDVSKAIHEDDKILSLSETVTTPSGTYKNCIKLEEVLADGDVEYKYFAKGIGVVREVPADGDVLLISHAATSPKPAK